MTLRQRQSVFALNFSKLILWIFEQGWECTLGEVKRPQEMQEIYLQHGKTKTINSKHLIQLAGDVNLFIDGSYITDREPYGPLAEYWKSLHPDNVAGYDWEWDANHFEMKQS